MTATAFDLSGPLPGGRTLIEASAGTGKTYSIAALVARSIAGDTAGPGRALSEGVSIDEILVVTFTRAAASELRDRIREILRLTADHLERDVPDATPAAVAPWMQMLAAGSHRVRHRRAARLRAALARFDEATITTIHGFCQQALAQSGLRAGADAEVELVEDNSELITEVCRDVLIDRLADHPLALSTEQNDCPRADDAPVVRPPSKIEGYVMDTVRAVLSNPAARRQPHPDAGGVAGAWATVVDHAVRQIGERQRVRRQIGYDRLITDLRDLLADPHGGPPLAEQLANRYRLVLVDEFQDTDRLQWEVFDLAFGRHRLVTVGDPKQAIYRFRGADVHAYLEAVERSERSTLATNHRSDRQLIDALGVLFNGATLGHEAIAFNRVEAAAGAPHNALGSGAALHIRVVPDAPTMSRTKLGLEAGGVQRIVLVDVASRIRTLLDEGHITDASGITRQVQPHDIAVLVPSQRRAAEAATVLRDWGIPSVRARTGSVLDSDAALQWRLLLAALALPTRAQVARAAGLGWFFNHDPVELTDEPDTSADVADVFETPMAALQRQLAVLAQRLRTSGVGAVYEALRADSVLLDSVVSRPNGDRDLADLDHIADLLVSATHGGSTEPARVQQTLDSLIASKSQSEATMRRIETDAEAVHITTIHSAKGLEYPIVLVPFAYVERTRISRPYVFNDKGGRVIDVASWVAWADDGTEGGIAGKQAIDQRKELARHEIDGDGLRLLYVALTRAKHRVEVWWAPMKGAATSAFGRLLLDRIGAGPVLNSRIRAEYERNGADVDAVRAQIDAIVLASNGTIDTFDVPLDQPVRRPLPVPAPVLAPLEVAVSTTRQPLGEPSWRSWSFTAITRTMEEAASSAVATGEGAELPTAGGHDEPVAAVDGAIPQLAARRHDHPDHLDQPDMPLAETVGGTTFGVMVHEILEHADFESGALADDVKRLVEAGAARAGLLLDSGALTAGLVAAIDTPLGALFDDRSLRDLPAKDRLAELTFDLAVDTRPASTGLMARRLGDVLATTLPDSDPMAAYGEQLAGELGSLSLAGWLTGSIDAVFRVGERFVVVDYKSNRLHEHGALEPLAAYRPDRLFGAMTHSHYPLQALLYSVALHRYLRWRLASRYDPHRHLGGIAYLFVRGMVGPSTPTLDGAPYGVFSWRPPTATILAIDDLLGGGDDPAPERPDEA